MNRVRLSAEIAKRARMTPAQAEAALVAMSEIVTEELLKKEKVQIVRFGVFEVKDRPARKARNPRTGEEMQLPDRHTVLFKPGKMLKEAMLALNGAEEE